MTKPRRIEKGTTYLVTRRCAQRQFLLRPSEEVNGFFLFCLAEATQRCGAIVHAYCVMPNHYHLVLTDVEGKLPELMHRLNMFVGRGLNAHYGRWESFWAPGSYSAVKLVDANDTLAKTVYALQNPVAAGLVSASEHWPGLCSRPDDMLGRQLQVPRPQHFFRKGGRIPETTTLNLGPPPEPPDVDRRAFVAATSALLEVSEEGHRERAKAKRKQFKGRRAVLRQDPFGRPENCEPRRGLNPRIACRDKWRRIEALQRLKSFEDRYRAAWERYQDGERDVPFPAGTYWMVVVAKQPCETAA